jgi:hypothetical protein
LYITPTYCYILHKYIILTWKQHQVIFLNEKSRWESGMSNVIPIVNSQSHILWNLTIFL